MDRLAIDREDLDTITILTLHGIVDSGTAQFLEEAFDTLASSSKVRIVADLSDIDYISSAGWGIFVGEIKGIRQKGGDIKLSGMHPDVREVFELLEFNTLLRPYGSRDEAIRAFAEQESTKTQ